ncbi:hypothetical protein PG2071B_0811 [Bifidobacterium pseudolongum subsp. globosum]|uniref:Uncharacterized protein n=1 Tax=Bifidobacterium pseudolongum subsp. globosum TaxID=1690 RepID=A0A4Q5A7L3_9BIFI|nr:hypothetical protein PG2071B_0811 [Bifidobacterium pseudolongum subsp. globosum]
MRDLVHVMPNAPDLSADALKLSNHRPLLSIPSHLVNITGLSGRLDEETRQRDAASFGQTGKFTRLFFVDTQRDDASPSCASLGLLPSRHASLPSSSVIIVQRPLRRRLRCPASFPGLRHSGYCPWRRRRHGGQVRILHTIRITCSTVRLVHPVRLVHRDRDCLTVARISIRWIWFFIRVGRWQHLHPGCLSTSGVPWREWFRAWSGRIGQVCLTRGRRAG